ncbi:MAG: hydrogenase maturation protein HypF, partial [Rhodospirillales bacterium]|nr:hydrogenase maturation protein HypF [Rhodospirillales bacterium]
MIALDLPFDSPPVLAVGAFLKNAVAAAKGRTLWLDIAQDNLDNPEAIRRFRAALAAMRERLGCDPVRIAHDLHPDF